MTAFLLTQITRIMCNVVCGDPYDCIKSWIWLGMTHMMQRWSDISLLKTLHERTMISEIALPTLCCQFRGWILCVYINYYSISFAAHRPNANFLVGALPILQESQQSIKELATKAHFEWFECKECKNVNSGKRLLLMGWHDFKINNANITGLEVEGSCYSENVLDYARQNACIRNNLGNGSHFVNEVKLHQQTMAVGDHWCECPNAGAVYNHQGDRGFWDTIKHN